MSGIKTRIFFDFLLLLSILVAPIYLSILIALFLGIRFKAYPEIIAFGVLADLMYGLSSSGILWLYTLSMSVVVVALLFIRPYLRS